MYRVPSVNMSAGIGVWSGRSNRFLKARYSILSSSSDSVFRNDHDSALASNPGIVTLSCNSSSTVVSIYRSTSVEAMEFILMVVA